MLSLMACRGVVRSDDQSLLPKILRQYGPGSDSRNLKGINPTLWDVFTQEFEAMRFITEMNSNDNHWLVLDTGKGNAVVGKHASATLAALDAFKREEETAITASSTLHLNFNRSPRH